MLIRQVEIILQVEMWAHIFKGNWIRYEKLKTWPKLKTVDEVGMDDIVVEHFIIALEK